MGAPSKAWICGCSLAGIAGSNPAGVTNVCLCDYSVLLGRGLYEELITPRPEESYRLWCVCV